MDSLVEDFRGEKALKMETLYQILQVLHDVNLGVLGNLNKRLPLSSTPFTLTSLLHIVLPWLEPCFFCELLSDSEDSEGLLSHLLHRSSLQSSHKSSVANGAVWSHEPLSQATILGEPGQ